VLERSPSLPPTGRTTFTNEAVDASSHEAVDALRTAVLFKLERTNPRLETRRADQRIRDFYSQQFAPFEVSGRHRMCTLEHNSLS
jgi:hypothetical protein